jgi:hypothetical protein
MPGDARDGLGERVHPAARYPPSRSDEQKGARGKVRECQACAVAPALNAVPLVSIMARRRMQGPPTFPETQYCAPSSSLIKSPSF